MPKITNESYVTLVSNDAYAIGAMVLAYSIIESGSDRMLTCMITEKVSQPVLSRLESVYDVVVKVDELDSQDSANLALLCRPELGVTFTKLFGWKLTQYQKCVFMDADTLIIKNVDEMFDREELSAAPDVGWPDCFNSGVFVFVPSETTFEQLIAFSRTNGSFDGGDQGLLNMFFSDWSTANIQRHLPFTFNLNANATYFYAPAYKQYGSDVRVIHFIGAGKPWNYARDASGLNVLPRRNASHTQEHVQMWWDVYNRHCAREDVAMVYKTVPVMPDHDFQVSWSHGEASFSQGTPHHQPAVVTPPGGFAAIQQKLDQMMAGSPYYDDHHDVDADDDDNISLVTSTAQISRSLSISLGEVGDDLTLDELEEVKQVKENLKNAQESIQKLKTRKASTSSTSSTK